LIFEDKMQHITFDISLPDGVLAILGKFGASTQEQQTTIVKQAVERYLEDMYWSEQAETAAKEGYHSQAESQNWLEEMHRAKD